MTAFRESRISYYGGRLQAFSGNGVLYVFEPETPLSQPLIFHDQGLENEIRGAFRSFTSHNSIECKQGATIDTYEIICVPECEARCFSNGTSEVFRSPTLSSNILADKLAQLNLDGIILDGLRLDKVLGLLRGSFKVTSAILLHIVLLGVKGAYPYSLLYAKKLRTDPFKHDTVILPSLTIPAGLAEPLRPLLEKHLLEGDIVLNEDF